MLKALHQSTIYHTLGRLLAPAFAEPRLIQTDPDSMYWYLYYYYCTTTVGILLLLHSAALAAVCT